MGERISNTLGAVKDGLRIAGWRFAEASKAMAPVAFTRDQEADFQRGKREAEVEVAANRVVRKAARSVRTYYIMRAK